MSRTAVLGFSSGIIVVAATLMAIALLNFPGAAGAAGSGPMGAGAAGSGPMASCTLAELPPEPGYGVTGTMLHPSCSDHAPQPMRSTAAR